MLRRIIVLVALAVLGAGAALVVVRDANAWTIDDANANGFSVNEVASAGNALCPEVYIAGHGSPYTDLGGKCDAGFQAALDGFMGQWCPCAQVTTTAAPVATTATTATAADPPPPPPATIDTVQAQIADLQSQVAALKIRVDRLEAAADAEWLAYHDALASGVDPVIASMIARQTGYDLIHGTGPFAP